MIADGYEWQGRPHKSLSAIARAITVGLGDDRNAEAEFTDGGDHELNTPLTSETEGQTDPDDVPDPGDDRHTPATAADRMLRIGDIANGLLLRRRNCRVPMLAYRSGLSSRECSATNQHRRSQVFGSPGVVNHVVPWISCLGGTRLGRLAGKPQPIVEECPAVSHGADVRTRN